MLVLTQRKDSIGLNVLKQNPLPQSPARYSIAGCLKTLSVLWFHFAFWSARLMSCLPWYEHCLWVEAWCAHRLPELSYYRRFGESFTNWTQAAPCNGLLGTEGLSRLFGGLHVLTPMGHGFGFPQVDLVQNRDVRLVKRPKRCWLCHT